MTQASEILTNYFQDVKLVRQTVSGSTKAFIYRGVAIAGADADLIPIAAQDGDEGCFTLWATLAPAKPEQVQQKRV